MTANGKPRAIIKGTSEEEFGDYLIENNPKFLKSMETAREKFLKKGGISTQNYLKKRQKEAWVNLPYGSLPPREKI